MLNDSPLDNEDDALNGDAPDQTGVNQIEQDILDFERTWWTESGPKDVAIVDRFSLSMGQYYEILNRLIDSEAALAYDPLVVRRLRRLRDRRRQARMDAVAEPPAN